MEKELTAPEYKLFASDVKNALSGAVDALFDVNYMATSTKAYKNIKCLKYSEIEPPNNNRNNDFTAKENRIKNQIIHSLSSQNYDKLLENINEWFDCLNGQSVSFEQVKKDIIALYSMIIWKFEEITSDFTTLHVFRNQALYLNSCNRLMECKSIFYKNVKKIIEVADSMFSNHASTDKIMQQAKKYIDDNITEKISLVSISNYCYLSPTYFSTMFKKYFGETFSNYINSVKMKKAHQMFLNGASVNQVAETLNYSEIKNLRRMFMKYYGMSPSKFLKQDHTLK